MSRIRRFWIVSFFLFVVVGTVLYASHGLPHGTYRTWDIKALAQSPIESVDDPTGLTAQVSAPAVITNVIAPGGSALLYWNPATDTFKLSTVPFGGFRFGVDVNRSLPSSGPPTMGGGDTWASMFSGPFPLYVQFRGSDLIRTWSLPTGGGRGIRYDQLNNRVYLADIGTRIFELDPIANTYRSWTLPQSAYRIHLQGSFVWATALGVPAAILRLDTVTNTVTRWAVPIANSPYALTEDAEGNIWFTDLNVPHVGKLNPLTNVIEKYTKPGMSNTDGIATTGIGPLLQVFFTEFSASHVSLLARALATPDHVAVVPPQVFAAPVASGVAPIKEFVSPPKTLVIPAVTSDSPSVDPEGIFRFPTPPFTKMPELITRVAFPQTVFGGFSGSPHVFQFTTASLFPQEPGKVTGGGFIGVGNGAATFGFTVQRKEEGAPVTGQLEYQNHITGENIHSVTITSLVITGNTATFDGTCRTENGPCTFRVTVQDNGEPGTSDTFTISGTMVPAGGTLMGGNIQVREE